ncbi:MAG: aldehyde dehydrogenase family protein [Deltaproteobacteria bacterium]|nr:MAG: aldehyde dehydrogenase family protein [Deltaproteobacteria bacterium]
MSSERVQRTVSPVDGLLYVERPLADDRLVDRSLDRARAAAEDWKRVPLAERISLLSAMVDAFVAERDEIAQEITWQMGRPIRYAPGEIRGFEERARTMLALAPDALADVVPGDKDGFTRFIRREPLGVVLVLAPWNYPYLTAVNTVVPALAAGNAVILKHAAQTPLCAERMTAAAARAGLPEGLFQHLHVDHDQVGRMVADPRVDFVAFTGSVGGGRAVHAAAAGRFTPMGLELGGKDPAYVRPDVDLRFAIDNIVDGAFFNSGQSCCGIERVYVHRDVYDEFVDGAVALVEQYVLGDPTDPETTLGPVVRVRAAQQIRAQVDAAIAAGARGLVDPARFPAATPQGVYLAPQVLVDVTHDMEVMREETFGPVVGIMPVSSDEEAIRLMNDSDYGLTASIWTADEAAVLAMGPRLETGTVFMNRADYLDPELAWTGVKLSGRGQTLSRLGYEQLTRPKSYHLRTRTG